MSQWKEEVIQIATVNLSALGSRSIDKSKRITLLHRRTSNSILDILIVNQSIQSTLTTDNEKLADSAVGKIAHDYVVQIAIGISSKVNLLGTAIIQLLQSQSDEVSRFRNAVFVAQTQTTGAVDFHLVGVEVEVTTAVIAKDGVVVVAEEVGVGLEQGFAVGSGVEVAICAGDDGEGL